MRDPLALAGEIRNEGIALVTTDVERGTLIAHPLYALVYFEQADRERTPKMFWDVNWSAIKAAIRGWVRDLAG
jgi:hypothetical protein